MFFKRKSHIEKNIDCIIEDMKLYLENNYKDLAIQSRKEAIVMVEESYQNKQLSDKKYGEYKTLLETYTQLMKNYNHQEFYHS